jgi:Zn-dependent M28 family amino/carboxypeptidase
LPVAPKRSILFLATTAEERGLLGARHYAQHPLYPLARTLADLNLDVVNTIGATRDSELTSSGKSDLDQIVRRQALEIGLQVLGKPEGHGEQANAS